MNVPELQLRSDLLSSPISLGDRWVWVLKDPLSPTLHYFDEREYGILRSLGEVGSFAELSKRYREHVDAPVLAQFVSSATRAGLLTTPSGAVMTPHFRRAPPRPRSRWWHQPLAIRLPGVTPDRLLRELPSTGAHSLKPLLGWTISLMLLAGLIMGIHFDEFRTDFSTASLRVLSSFAWQPLRLFGASMGGTLLVFAFAIMITKVIHELAHAWVCVRLGGRCREMGVLLLLGIPCLYCDVSDAWLIPRRRDRILVSAAGMIAECLIASFAVFVWAVTSPGVLHDLAALIVVVASVSTLLINANPLLRYDGYYILSDWLGVPNLSNEANAEVRSFCARIFTKHPYDVPDSAPDWTLIAYAVASGVYRIFVLGLILWAVYCLMERWIGIGAALPTTVWLGFAILRSRFANLMRGGGEGRQHSALRSTRYRAGIVRAGGALSFLAVLLIPLPRSLRVAALIRPLDERAIYVSSPCTLVSIDSQTGIPQLDDWRLRLREQIARGSVAELRAELAASRITRLDRSDSSRLQPILQDQIRSAEDEQVTVVNRLNDFRLDIDPETVIYDPPRRRISKRERIAERSSWTGLAVSETNLGATLPSGTLIGRTGHRFKRSASLFVPQQWIDAVRVGDFVSLGYRSLPSGSIEGNIVSISTDPVDKLPEEILASRWRRRANFDSGGEEVHYEVMVSLDRTAANEFVFPARTVSPARIHVPRSSLFSRWRRWMRENF